MNRRTIIIAFLVFALLMPGIFQQAHLAQAAGNQLSSSGFEQEGIIWDENGAEQGVADQAYNWHAFGLGYTRTTQAARPNTGWYGMKAVSGSTTGMVGAYQRVDFNQTVIRPVYVGGYIKGQSLVMAPGSYFGASIYTEIHLKNGQTVYWNTPATSGIFDWQWVGFNTAQLGNMISAPIDYIFVVPSLINASGTAYFDDLNVKQVDSSDATEAMMSDYVAPTPTPPPAPVQDGWQYIRPYGWVYVFGNYIFYNGHWIRR
jgi:hypothetical protein